MKRKTKVDPIDTLLDAGDAMMKAVPEGYKALLVFVDEKGQAHMTNSCCDACGQKMAQAAFERYSQDLFGSPEQASLLLLQAMSASGKLH